MTVKYDRKHIYFTIHHFRIDIDCYFSINSISQIRYCCKYGFFAIKEKKMSSVHRVSNIFDFSTDDNMRNSRRS